MDYNKLAELLGDLEDESLMEEIDSFLSTNPDRDGAMAAVNACQEGMKIVGERFEEGEYFVGDLVFAGEILGEAIEKLQSVLGSDSVQSVGKMVVGTVAGDLHDIGKNIFSSIAGTSGFEVHDLGIDVSAEAFVEKVKELKPEVLGLSGILTLSVESMKATITALKEAGLRDSLKILIGGTAVSKDVCEFVGADMYTTNASEGVSMCLDALK